MHESDTRSDARQPILNLRTDRVQEVLQSAEPKTVRFSALCRYATAGDRIILLLAFLGAVAQGAAGPAMSFFMKDLFQSIFMPNDNGTLPPTLGPHTERDRHILRNLYIFLCLAAGSFTCCTVSYLGFAHVADRMTLKLRSRFFEQLLRKDVGWYDSHSASEMATRLTNDTYDFRQGLGEKFAGLIVGLVTSPAGFAVAFIQDWRLTLMMLGAIPFMASGFAIAMRTMATSAAKQQESYAKAGGLAETTISSIRTVAAFNGFELEVSRYDRLLAEAEKSGARAGWCNGLSMGASAFIIYATFALGFYAGSFLVVRDYNNNCWVSNPPFGTCFTGATMLSTLFAVLQGGIGISQAAMPMAALTAAKAAAGRIYAVIDEPAAFNTEAGEAPVEAHGRIDFQDVVFFYPSRPETPSLNGLSFSIAAGSTAAFVGPSGSGKSTTIALLQRFYDTTSGSVSFDGRNIRNLSLKWLRSKMALVQQEPVLFGGTIAENVSFGCEGEVTDSQIEAAARSANAWDFIRSFPQGFQTLVGERGSQLSGGQKQRIAIARAMIRNPAVLLLDEATSALDSESEQVVQKALDELMKQKARTTLVVAHRLSTVREADQIFVLENGRLVERGTHNELLAKSGSLYAQLVQLQELTGVVGPKVLQRQHSNTSAEVSPRKRQHSSSFHSPLHAEVAPLERLMSMEEPTVEMEEEQPPQPLPVPKEDDEDVDVPTSRLWGMQPQVSFVIAALLATLPVGAARPLMGRLFGSSSNTFSKPPAIKIGGMWIGILDTEELQRVAHEQSLEFLILGVLLCVCTATQLGCFRKAAESLTRQVRLLSFRAMLRQEIAWFDLRSSGHLADRLASEAPLIKSFTGENLAAAIQVLVTVGVGLGMALYASWRQMLTLCNAVFLPLLAVGSLLMFRALRRSNDTRAGPLVSEAMGNIRTVAAFSLEARMLSRYSQLLASEGQSQWRASRATGLGAAYNSGITYVMFAGVVFVANLFISAGELEPDAVLNVLFPIMFAATGAAVASQWQADKAKARKAVNHFFQTLDRTPAIDAYNPSGLKPHVVRGHIEFRHVSFRYPSRLDIPIFANFDLTIQPGQTVALCGPSGSGKSTAIALLQRFYDPEIGSILLDGQDIRGLNLAWLRSKMALVQQEPVLFAGTILENIAYGQEGGASQAQCEAAAAAANASFIKNFPQGFQTQVGERGAQLSGGQKQRIAIARAMVRDPSILLLDEATSALDSESERIVQEALDRLLAQKRRTTLVIAHRLSTIVGSDVICVVYQGRIVEKGTHKELLEIPAGHYRRLAARQQAVDP